MDTLPLPDAGSVAGPPTPVQLRELHSLMAAVRLLDVSAVAWQRQGIIPGYAPELGQEAAQVGSGYAVDLPLDFVWQKGAVDLNPADAAGNALTGAGNARGAAPHARRLGSHGFPLSPGGRSIDAAALVTSVQKTRRAVVVHEAPLMSGLGAEVAQLITQGCFDILKAPVERVTGFDVLYPSRDLEDEYIPNIERILFGVQRVLEYRRG